MFLRIPTRRSSVPSNSQQRPVKPLRRPRNGGVTFPTQVTQTFTPVPAPKPLPPLVPPLQIFNQYFPTPINVMAEDMEMDEMTEDVPMEDISENAMDFELEYKESDCMEFVYTGAAVPVLDYFSFGPISDTLAMLDDASHDDSDSDSDSEDEAIEEEEDDEDDEWYEVDEPSTPSSPTSAFGAWRSPKRAPLSPRGMWSL